MQLREKIVILRAHFQRWPTVDLARLPEPRSEERIRHMVVSNCAAVDDRRIPGFVLRYPDGSEEYFTRGKAARHLGRPFTPQRHAILSFLLQMPLLDQLEPEFA